MDMFLNEPEFSYEPFQQPSQQGTSLNEQQSTTANDAYQIDQLKQQLMGDSSLSNLFVLNEGSKFLTEVPAKRTCRGDPFFSLDMCNERVVLQMEPQQHTSNQSFQQPSTQVVQLSAFVTENQTTVLAENQCGFAQNASTGQPLFLGSTHDSIYRVLPHGSQVTVMQGKVGPSSSQVRPWLQQSPCPSSSSAARYSPSSETTSASSQQQQQQQQTKQQPPQQTNANYAMSIMCLQNEVHPNNCRRGSTGSLQHGKGKKHVTFLCPQVRSFWLPSPGSGYPSM